MRAVDGVSLAVDPGEFVALYGPSGSGKTTLLLLAAGADGARQRQRVVRRPRRRRGSRRARRRRFRRSDVGFVFQSFHLMPAATALDNAAVKLLAERALARRPRISGRGRGWSASASGRACEHTPRELSKGECQRVAIARALANEPRLLLADEPTGNLDSQRSREVLALLRELCDERGIPVLLVTHDPQRCAFVDRVYTLRDGMLRDGLDVERSHAAPT